MGEDHVPEQNSEVDTTEEEINDEGAVEVDEGAVEVDDGDSDNSLGSDIDDDTDDESIVEEEGPDEEEIAKTKPKRITLKDTVFQSAFHPTKDILALGEITGNISIFSFSNEGNTKLIDFKHQKEACRCLAFSLDGQRLYSGCQDNSIYCTDMNTGSLLHTIPNAHDESISAMHLISDNFIASGCEGGIVKVWDMRTFSKAAELSPRKDYISSLTTGSQKSHLLATSGDGVLSVFNWRKNAIVKESDQLDDELLCLDIIKGGKKVICGSATGVLNIYSWGEWGDISDRYPTEHSEVESICTVSDDIVCIGTDDGKIQAMFVQPYKLIRTLGRHGAMGVSSLKVSPNKNLLVSCGSDESARFWNIEDLQDECLEEEERRGVKRKKTQVDEKAAAFFADL